MTDPETRFSFPKDLHLQMFVFTSEVVSIECKYSILGLLNSPTNSPLWASAVLWVNEFSDQGEFGTYYWETRSVCKPC